MKITADKTELSNEITAFINQRKTVNLASIDANGDPLSSYAPFAVGDNCLYVLLSDIARHGLNLVHHPDVSALIIEDESESANIFARIRVNLNLRAKKEIVETPEWKQGIDHLLARHGRMIINLSQLSDFHLFKLTPISGRYVKGFGQAFSFKDSLNGENLTHLSDGHEKRTA